jgi:hypothetical protein
MHRRWPAMKTHLIRLERIVEELNAWLLVIAFGLAVLYVTVLMAKCLPVLPAATAADIPRPAGVPHVPTQQPGLP